MKVQSVVPRNIKNRLEKILYRTVAVDRFVTTIARETSTTNRNPCHNEWNNVHPNACIKALLNQLSRNNRGIAVGFILTLSSLSVRTGIYFVDGQIPELTDQLFKVSGVLFFLIQFIDQFFDLIQFFFGRSFIT